MPEVIIHDDETFERALKQAGILSDLRKHRHFERPGERRKPRQSAARRIGRRERYWA